MLPFDLIYNYCSMTTTIPDMAWRCSLDMHMKEDNSKLEDLGLNILTPQTLLNLTRTVFNKYATKWEVNSQSVFFIMNFIILVTQMS